MVEFDEWAKDALYFLAEDPNSSVLFLYVKQKLFILICHMPSQLHIH